MPATLVEQHRLAAIPTRAEIRYTARFNEAWMEQQRFVGDWLLWGKGAGWWGTPQNGGTLYATQLRRPERIERLSLDHGVDRIEAMGRESRLLACSSFDQGIVIGQTREVYERALGGPLPWGAGAFQTAL